MITTRSDGRNGPFSSNTNMSSGHQETLRRYYDALYNAFGPQGWWPGESPTEIIVGAILTQNTNWRNVARAIEALRDAKLLDWAALRRVPVEHLSKLIRPAGYYNLKATRLKHFVEWLWQNYAGNLKNLKHIPLARLREQLLSINGIGPETADSILLYALDRPTFVVDAYTRRLAIRHGLARHEARYDDVKRTFEDALPPNARLFNEYHALIVAVGKRHCRPSARCDGCPLERFPHDAGAC